MLGNKDIHSDWRETMWVTKSQNRCKICSMLCFMIYMEVGIKAVHSLRTWFFHFPDPWNRDFEEQKTADFKGNVRFLLLCVLKRSLSVVFAIMCRHILLRNRENMIVCCKSSKILRNPQCLYRNILLRYLVLMIS